ncbi:universal stress protein [Robiginitalea myxolifaciens]|nr:universal stress protein [Robiginitalea myxolifaciens]
MKTINKILIPFDFTEAAINALDYALEFAGYDKPIAITAVYLSSKPVSEYELQETQTSFRNIVADLNKKPMISPALRVTEGALPSALLELQTESEADLIIMGTMGDTSLDQHVTNTSNLVLEAECPVISVPMGSESKRPEEIALVLGKEEIEDASVLDFLLAVARSFNAKVHVLTIYAESVYAEKVEVASNEDSLEYYLENFYVEHSFEKNQDVEQGIYNYLEDKNIDLLVIIPRNHARKTEPSDGRLTKLLTLHSRVPILSLD